MNFLMRAVLLLAIVVLAGCPASNEVRPLPAPQPERPVAVPAEVELLPSRVSITFRTEPAGGSIQVADRRLRHGETAEFEPGTYRATARLAGYRDGTQTFRVSEGQAETVIVRLGPGFGVVDFAISPADAAVRVDGLTVDPAGQQELSQGRHRLEVSAPGHFPAESSFEVEPGSRQTLAIELEPIPTAASVLLEAHHPDARLFLNGEELGTGAVRLERLEFGEHRIESLLDVSSWRREFGQADFVFESDGAERFSIEEAEIQWRIEDDWIPEPEARQRERQAYLGMRVERPTSIESSASAGWIDSFKRLSDPAAWIHSHLRVGDRLVVRGHSQTWIVWKRSSDLSPAFRETVSALVSGSKDPSPWPTANDSSVASLSSSASSLGELIGDLVTSRGAVPMIDLDRPLLLAAPEAEIPLNVSARDRDAELLIVGGEGVSVSGRDISRDEAGLIRLPLDGANRHEIRWAAVPDRILSRSNRAEREPPAESQALKANEKRLLRIDSRFDPQFILQITNTPDEDRPVRWERLEAFAGPGGNVDLKEVEIGPHGQAGAYRRIWVAVGASEQRQFEQRYSVSDERIETETDIFLRRELEPETDRDGGG